MSAEPSLSDQIAAIEFARSVVGRAPAKMRLGEREDHERKLDAAIKTLREVEETRRAWRAT